MFKIKTFERDFVDGDNNIRTRNDLKIVYLMAYDNVRSIRVRDLAFNNYLS